MKYLTVGTNEIRDDLFRNIENTESIKPRGGLWLTQYDERIKDYNHWVDFILMHPNILFYKTKNGSPWVQPCSVVNLNEDTKLFSLDSVDNLDFLMNNYPLDDQKFSYQKLSKDYDGIYVDLGHLFHDNYDYKMRENFSSFGVSSLVLFNLDCIDYYQAGNVIIEPFDYEDSLNFDRYYQIDYSDVKKKVLKK